MTRQLLLFALILGIQLPNPLRAQPAAAVAKLDKQPVDSAQRIQLLKVQIVLDRAGFRPGRLDGLGGEFTQGAHDRFNASNGLPPGQLLDLSSVAEPLRDYTLTEEDLEWVGKTASSPAAQEKLPNMPYADAWELVAEKFHSDLDYIRELNPNVSEPAAGTVFRVPDVEEFSMQAVIDLNDRRKSEAKAEKEAAAATPTPVPSPSPTLADVTPEPSSDATTLPDTTEATLDASVDESVPTVEPTASPVPEPKVARLVILREPRIIELYEDDKLVGSYPCTPGSDRVPVPVGTWKITSNILMPYFRYDKSVLKDGTRSDNAFNIPPGPNNYVGIVWMGINRKSVGIHGTNNPDRIGRNQSSGCIRLANWDAYEVTQRIKVGTPVEVR